MPPTQDQRLLNDWISIEKRMPEEDEDVLFVVQIQRRDPRTRTLTGEWWSEIEVGHYHGDWFEDGRVWTDKHGEFYFHEHSERERITHWMPLPVPPDTTTN